MKEKSQYWQVIRGICILAVIIIHCPSGTTYSEGTFPYVATMVLRQFINFPVAVFFFLAGYFTNIKQVANNPKAHLLNRRGIY